MYIYTYIYIFFTDYRQSLKQQVYMRYVTSEWVMLTEMNPTPCSLNIKIYSLF